MNKTIKKILIGKLFKFNPWLNTLFVIVGVRYNPYHNIIDILVGRVYLNAKEIQIYSWYQLNKYDIHFWKRSSKEEIKKCLKTNPDKIKYHIGECIDISKFEIYEYKTNYYQEYLNQQK
jgi:hypothetical protein